MFISVHNARVIADEMKKLIGRDINIMDERGIILASTNPSRSGTLHEGAARVMREKLSLLVVENDESGRGMQQGINLPIVSGGRPVGVIGITGPPSEVSLFGSIIKRMTELMIDNIRQNDRTDLADREKRDFLEEWIFADKPNWERLRIRGSRFGFDTEKPCLVALLRIVPAAEFAAENADENADDNAEGVHMEIALGRIRERLCENPCCHAMIFRGRILMLFYQTSGAQAIEELTEICRFLENLYGFFLCGGMSSEDSGEADIRRSYAEAEIACALSGRAGHGTIVPYDRYSPEFIAWNMPGKVRQRLYRSVFGFPHSPEDMEEMLQTIRLYFEYNGDIREISARMYIHENTFRYRINRLKNRTGYDLRKPAESMVLFFAMLGSSDKKISENNFISEK